MLKIDRYSIDPKDMQCVNPLFGTLAERHTKPHGMEHGVVEIRQQGDPVAVYFGLFHERPLNTRVRAQYLTGFILADLTVAKPCKFYTVENGCPNGDRCTL